MIIEIKKTKQKGIHRIYHILTSNDYIFQQYLRDIEYCGDNIITYRNININNNRIFYRKFIYRSYRKPNKDYKYYL